MEKLLSVCLIARDEAPNVVACLDSVREAADECLVVDTGSTDDTPRLAAAAGARIFHRPWDDDFSAARNFALKKARGRFAFFIDADERLPAVDAPKLRKAAGLPGLEAGRVIIDNVDQGGQVMGRHRLIRLLRRGPGIRFQGRIHETPVGYIKPPVDLDVRLIHTGYDPEAAGRKYERNRRLLDLELADDPASARLHWLAAQTQAALGRPAEALDLARRGLDLDDGALPALTANLTRTEVMCLAALDRLAEAEEAARRYLVREPLFADLHFYLGQVRLRQGDGPDAERSLNAFLKVLHQMENDPAILSRFGFAATIGEAGRAAQDVARLMFARQDFKGGATVLARAVTLCPDDAGLRASWAQALAAAGDKATARRQAEAVLELDPANEAARRVIEQLARTGPDF